MEQQQAVNTALKKDEKAIIRVIDLVKTFKVGKQQVPVLKGLNFDIPQGSFTMITGPSGCGKSTLLHIILGLEQPTLGKVEFLGQDIYKLPTDDDRGDIRKKHIGMVYQQSNWIKAFTVIENVAFPLLLLGVEKSKAIEKAEEMLERVGLQEWRNYIPTELSGGQQQRVSLARALVNNPEIIIADEPTGNLDYKSGQRIMSLLRALNHDLGKTIIMVTHNMEQIPYSTVSVQMLDGEITGVYSEEDRMKIVKDVTKFSAFRDQLQKPEMPRGYSENEITSSLILDEKDIKEKEGTVQSRIVKDGKIVKTGIGNIKSSEDHKKSGKILSKIKKGDKIVDAGSTDTLGETEKSESEKVNKESNKEN